MNELLATYIKNVQKTVDGSLRKYLPEEKQYPESIHQSMHYSLFAGGKRIRPALALAAYELCGGNPGDEKIQYVCCAAEMLHVFSLIHDDLPCMDDDDFRRGKPTNHRVYGEAIAVLGGDALCIHAFELLGRTGNCRVICEIGNALGTQGMIGGQVVDVESEGKPADEKVLQYIHTHKTGAFIRSCLRAGAMLAGAGDDMLRAITVYGENIGLAFQVADDILDVEGTTEQIGKDAGSDESKGKMTYPSIFGLDQSKKEAERLVAEAKESLEIFGGKADLLREVADYIILRVN